MSADNYIYVFRRAEDGWFGVSMEMGDGPPRCSSEYASPNATDALVHAHRCESEEAIVEYGVRLGPGVLDALSDEGKNRAREYFRGQWHQ